MHEDTLQETMCGKMISHPEKITMWQENVTWETQEWSFVSYLQCVKSVETHLLQSGRNYTRN